MISIHQANTSLSLPWKKENSWANTLLPLVCAAQVDSIHYTRHDIPNQQTFFFRIAQSDFFIFFFSSIDMEKRRQRLDDHYHPAARCFCVLLLFLPSSVMDDGWPR